MKILVVRRDNIGDLVCTTPLFTALRRRFPQAWIGALVNSYNAPVLDRNPDLDEVLAYTKLKHAGVGSGVLSALRERIALLWNLRRMRLDYVVLATSDFVPRIARLAHWLAPKRVVGFADGPNSARWLDLAIKTDEVAGRHEVERVFALARFFGIDSGPPPLTVVPDRSELDAVRAKLGQASASVAVHISARRPAQRWPAQRFAELITRLHRKHGWGAALVWSPGPPNHPTHPGDDEKAREVIEAVGRQPWFIPYSTGRLAQLIGCLAACDAVICSDGGAMHLAAALGKPTVALFGDSSAERWRPWTARYDVLQPPSRNVGDVLVEDVARAFQRVTAAVAA